MLNTVSWFLIALQLCSLHFLSKRSIVGWILGTTVQIGWFGYGVVTEQHAFVLGCLASLVIHVKGMWRASACSRSQLKFQVTNDKCHDKVTKGMSK